MEIKEAQEKRKILERTIVELLRSFELETNLFISRLDFDEINTSNTGGRAHFISVKVRIEL